MSANVLSILSGKLLNVPSGKVADFWSAPPSGNIAANTDYCFTLRCNPAATTTIGSRVGESFNAANAAPGYTLSSGSWVTRTDYRFNFRVYIDGVIRDSVEDGTGGQYIGKEGIEKAIAQVFNVGANGGTLTKVEINVNSIYGGGATNVECVVKTGANPNAGDVIVTGEKVDLTSTGWFTMYQA